MPRLFSAIPLPEWAIDQLASLRGGLPFASWLEPEDYHITLAYFGEVQHHVADEIVGELDRIYAAPCSLEVTGVGSFSRKSQAHSLYAEIRLTDDLAALHRDHRRVLRKLGLPPDRHSYRPHVTLARLSNKSAHDGERDQLCATWLTERSHFKLPPFIAHAFALYSSTGSLAGRRYHQEDAFPLRLRPARSSTDP